MRNWIQDGSDSGSPNAYLIKFTSEGSHFGWQHADATGVIDVLMGRTWCDYSGEIPDVINVYLLTADGPVPVVISQVSMPTLGMVDVALKVRPMGKKGRALLRTVDTGAYKMPEA